MIELSEEEYPKTVAEADYYLVLTAFYEYGGAYESAFGRESPIYHNINEPEKYTHLLYSVPEIDEWFDK